MTQTTKKYERFINEKLYYYIQTRFAFLFHDHIQIIEIRIRVDGPTNIKTLFLN